MLKFSHDNQNINKSSGKYAVKVIHISLCQLIREYFHYRGTRNRILVLS